MAKWPEAVAWLLEGVAWMTQPEVDQITSILDEDGVSMVCSNGDCKSQQKNDHEIGGKSRNQMIHCTFKASSQRL